MITTPVLNYYGNLHMNHPTMFYYKEMHSKLIKFFIMDCHYLFSMHQLQFYFNDLNYFIVRHKPNKFKNTAQ